MLYSDLYGRLIILTKRNDITHVEIGKCINLEKGAITGRAKRNSCFKPEEVKKIEKYFNVDLSIIPEQQETQAEKIEKTEDISIIEKTEKFGIRLSCLQEKFGLSDTHFAKILGLFTNEYIELKNGGAKPNLCILNALKQNFKVSIDWLLYGN